jgi:hypothetical protein
VIWPTWSGGIGATRGAAVPAPEYAWSADLQRRADRLSCAWVERLRGDGAAKHEEIRDRRDDTAELRALASDLGDHHRAAHGGDRVRRADLNFLARPHLLARDRERELSRVELDRRAPRDLGDGEHRALADGHDRLAAEQHPCERLLAGHDGVLQEDVVLELQGDGGGEGHAPGADRPFQRRDDPGLGPLCRGRGGEKQGTEGHD